MAVENISSKQGEQSMPIGPEEQAAKLAALVEKPSREQLRSQLIEGSWREATPEQRRAHNEALAQLEIKPREVLEMCAQDPELQAILEKGAREWRKRDINVPMERRIVRDERQQRDFEKESILRGGVFAVKRELASRGVLDSRYIRIDQ